MVQFGKVIDNFVARSRVLRVPNPVLHEMYSTRTVVDGSGQRYPLDGVVTVPHANALYRLVKQVNPRVALEVGMAYGGSTLAILTALNELDGDGTLISIDPAQSSYWHNVGLANVARCGFKERHRFIEDTSFAALPSLLKEKTAIDFAYVDGMHTFDYTLLDFFYIDKMLNVGGIVGFNDCYMPSVKRVIRFLLSHRRYRELDVGLKRSYLSRNVKQMARNIVTMTSKQDRYFQKKEQWEPNWDYYARF